MRVPKSTRLIQSLEGSLVAVVPSCPSRDDQCKGLRRAEGARHSRGESAAMQRWRGVKVEQPRGERDEQCALKKKTASTTETEGEELTTQRARAETTVGARCAVLFVGASHAVLWIWRIRRIGLVGRGDSGRALDRMEQMHQRRLSQDASMVMSMRTSTRCTTGRLHSCNRRVQPGTGVARTSCPRMAA